MPTANRRRFIPAAITQFFAQDYPASELVILDDGTDPCGDLVPAHPAIRYIRTPRHSSLGAKRNAACEAARGDIILHWDDDDWYAPHRIHAQVEALCASGADICGIDHVLFLDPRAPTAWEYVYPPGGAPWVYGATLCYRKSFWRRSPFSAMNVGEDISFVANAGGNRIKVLPEQGIYVGLIHGANTSPKQTHDSRWQALPLARIETVMGPDWGANPQLFAITSSVVIHGENAARHSHNLSAPEPEPRKDIPMIAVARQADLNLSEFCAFNSGQTLPRMRQWELPFILFGSRLSSTMSVLDCTINPVDISDRLRRLYPHVLYRHWYPIQNGAFCLPIGVPDESFDRVICVNTLEHLLHPQREALIKVLAKKLKPRGWLALTSDYYFDSFWDDPAFLAAGVMRADRLEVFNGFNKVTIEEWTRLCKAHGLFPLLDSCEDPAEDDVGLYRQVQPFRHACIGGIFKKGEELDEPRSRRVLLALLTWNTRDASLDSLSAYLREAAMLHRLGHRPYLCVCDNGSTDGTPAALRELEREIDIPYRFIFNQENKGNSIARNQILSYLQECDAEYALLMDGDIEIVPFSSFAMLRYMEDQGSRLGCIGACSAGQTPYRESASSAFYSIDRVETTNLVAWTQYGMFRREVFEEGIRFDESEAFTGPGWGFEDNDLAFQMDMKGFVNQRFFGMTYLHRNARSSIRVMKQLGIDVHTLYEKRKRYVIDKWASVPPINNGPLRFVRAVCVPL